MKYGQPSSDYLVTLYYRYVKHDVVIVKNLRTNFTSLTKSNYKGKKVFSIWVENSDTETEKNQSFIWFFY